VGLTHSRPRWDSKSFLTSPFLYRGALLCVDFLSGPSFLPLFPVCSCQCLSRLPKRRASGGISLVLIDSAISTTCSQIHSARSSGPLLHRWCCFGCHRVTD